MNENYTKSWLFFSWTHQRSLNEVWLAIFLIIFFIRLSFVALRFYFIKLKNVVLIKKNYWGFKNKKLHLKNKGYYRLTACSSNAVYISSFKFFTFNLLLKITEIKLMHKLKISRRRIFTNSNLNSFSFFPLRFFLFLRFLPPTENAIYFNRFSSSSSLNGNYSRVKLVLQTHQEDSIMNIADRLRNAFKG